MEEKTVNTALDGIMPIDEAVQLFEKVSQPPQDAMKYIDAGKLKGKNEINPLWRMKAMTENYGNYGNGWKYEIVDCSLPVVFIYTQPTDRRMERPLTCNWFQLFNCKR